VGLADCCIKQASKKYYLKGCSLKFSGGGCHARLPKAHENTNGLVRQFLRKGASFAKVSNKLLETIEAKLNNRPRRSLSYKTPNEVVESRLYQT